MPRTAFAARGICGFGLCGRAAWEPLHRFQSTRPVWGATSALCSRREPHLISIHAPRVGRDFTYTEAADGKPEFQSTRPVWGATPEAGTYSNLIKFQSTRPVWGATAFADSQKVQYIISIHAPRVGRDVSLRYRLPTLRKFQSTRPVWGATTCRFDYNNNNGFQSTRPVWGATSASDALIPSSEFQSTRPVWGATANLTILTRQICTKGTKEFLLGRKTHEERGKLTQKLAYIHAFSAFFRREGAGTFCALVLRTQ